MSERVQAAALAMILLCGYGGYVSGVWVGVYGAGVYLFIAIAVVILPFLAFIAGSRPWLWLLLGATIMTAAAIAAYVLVLVPHYQKFDSDAGQKTERLLWFLSGLPVAVACGTPGVALGVGMGYLVRCLREPR